MFLADVLICHVTNPLEAELPPPWGDPHYHTAFPPSCYLYGNALTGRIDYFLCSNSLDALKCLGQLSSRQQDTKYKELHMRKAAGNPATSNYWKTTRNEESSANVLMHSIFLSRHLQDRIRLG